MIRKRLTRLLLAAMMAFSAFSVSAEGDNSSLTAKLSDSSVEIAGTTSAGYVQIVVMKPLRDFSEITAENFKEIVYYTDTLAVTGGGFLCKISLPEDAENGRYAVKAIFNEESGCAEMKTSFFKTSNEYTKEMTAAYLSADKSNFRKVFETYGEVYDETDLFAKEIGGLLIEHEEAVSECFIIAKNGMVNHTFTETPETVTALGDITNMLKCTLMLYHMSYSDDFEAYVELYRETMPLVFDENYDKTEFSHIFKMVREKDVQNTDKTFVNAVRKTIGLSLILNGSNADKAKALERFSSELGIAKKTLENSGFALLEIAKYLENDEAAVKEYAGGMESAVKDAIDALEKKNNSGGSGSAGGSGSGSGSGSSGGRGNSSISVGNREPAGTPDPSTPPDTPEPNPPFCDLDGVLWAKDAILNLYQKKIISGKENGRFAPQDNLSREEAVKILVGAFGLFEKQEDLHFSDCNVEDWYYPYVSIAVKSGIVRGISETLFGTGTNINRQDFAVMLSRTLTAAGCKLNGAKAVSFADGEAISEYARADVDALSANGLFVGDESQRFYPQNSITRAEAAVAIERAVNFTESSQEVQP